MTEKTTDQDPGYPSEDLQNLSPKMAEHFKALQKIAQAYGVTATLAPQNKDRSTPTTTRFIFLAKGTPGTTQIKNLPSNLKRAGRFGSPASGMISAAYG